MDAMSDLRDRIFWRKRTPGPHVFDLDPMLEGILPHVDVNESWVDYIDWKGIRSEGFSLVRVDGQIHAFHKHGLHD